MAITWDVNIRPLDIARKEVSVSATRTDDTDPENVKTETHTILSVIIETTAQKIAVMDQIWEMHLTEVTKQSQIEAIIGSLESQAKANLEARE